MRRPLPLLLALACLAGCGPRHYFVRARVVDGRTGDTLPGTLIAVASSGMMAPVDTTGLSPATEVRAGDTVTASHPGYFPADAPLAGLAAGDTTMVDIAVYRDLPRTVEGHVTDADSKRGLYDAAVRVRGTDVGTRTGPGGFYRIDGFPHGPRIVEASHTGYVEQAVEVTAPGGETTMVAIALRDTTNEGSVEGRVYDRASGAAIPGITVRVEGLDIEAVTDGDGRFRLARVPAGEHELTAFADSYGFKTIPFRVTRGWTVGVDFALERPGPRSPDR